jgi:predicted Zn finger-like uncharacterized protein
MRVVCDNCAASYKIPDSKLTKEVNKATCRKCGHAIFIKRAGEEDPRPAPPPPEEHGEERTLITSAADLERAVRSRAGTGFDESADQRPTTVSLENQGEQSVPREALAPSPFPPPPVAAAPSGSLPPPRPPAAAPPPRAAAISPSAEVAPPPPLRLPPQALSAEPTSAAAAGATSHDPRTDLSMALVALVVSVVGVLVLSLSAWLQSPVVTGLGAFLALFGTFVVALILLTGGRGTRAASLAIAFLGGLVLSGALGGVIGALLMVLAPSQPSLPLVATPTPPAPVVEAPPVAPAVVEAPPVVEPPLAVAPPVVQAPPVAPPPAVVTPPAAPPVAVAAAPAAKSTPPAASSTARTSTATKSTTSDAPARIAPSTTSSSSSSTKSTASTASTKTTAPASTSTGSSSSGAAASSGVSVVVIDTMIKSNKAVKSCFVQQRNETGELPKGVKVKLTIQDSGKVSSASLPSGDLKGSDFDSCLSGAVKSIQFPPFEGDPVTVTYPFVF